jgi:hypothetical protein
MKFVSNFFNKVKDGGQASPVDAYFLIEMKGLFSIALLKFNKGARENYHSHAFNALTWFIKGTLVEQEPNSLDKLPHVYTRSFLPKLTPKGLTHRVKAYEDSWCLTIRGPWDEYWTEYNEELDKTTILTHGRRTVGELEGYIPTTKPVGPPNDVFLGKVG